MKKTVNKPGLFKRLLSFVVPVIIESYPSDFSKVLEIRLINNRFVLDTQNANYSYGTLHKVMETGMLRVLKREKQIRDILMLGYGGGSLSSIASDHIRSSFSVTAVEIDPKVIEVAKSWFPQPNVNFVCIDAREFIASCTEQFDLVVSDVFIDLTMPGFATEKDYLTKLRNLLKPGGSIIINTIYKEKREAIDFHRLLATIFKEVEHIHIFEENHLFVIHH